MRLIMAAVGRMKAGAEQELCQRYVDRTRRIGRNLGLRGPDIVEIDDGRPCGTERRMDEEGARLYARLPVDCKRVLLDERGEVCTSRQFADSLACWRDETVPAVAFLIGGADGHGSRTREQAHSILSLGAMTWPHMLVRVMLAEQIYRSVTLLSSHPYHR